MNIMISDKIQSVTFADIACPICEAGGMTIDLTGWLHCKDCCSLTPEAFDALKSREIAPLDAAKVAEKIAADFGFNMAQVRGQMRDAKISKCRAHIFYALHKHGLSFNAIAKLCSKDHSSVSYAVKKMEAGLAKD